MSVTVQDALLQAALGQAGLCSVEGAFGYAGGEDLSKPNLGIRRRTRLTLTDSAGNVRELYLKRYGRPGLGARLPACLRRGGRWSSACAEFDAICAARAAGVPTMEAVAFGQECPWCGGRSYLVVSAVPGDALERVGEAFFAACAGDREKLALFTAKLAQLVRALHAAGLVHRDLYASHVFLHERGGDFDLYLIDLARVFSPRWRRFRWRVKDLSQLHYSMPAKWVRQCWTDFLRQYLGGEADLDRWQRAIQRKSESIRRRQERKARSAARTVSQQGSAR
jgi:tRNA A-37 threonylcarbamoyl transferase component Bud32